MVGTLRQAPGMTATVDRVDTLAGVLGSMNVTMLTYPKNLEGSITIIGERGTAWVGGVAVNRIDHWEFAEPHPDDALVSQASYDPREEGPPEVAIFPG